MIQFDHVTKRYGAQTALAEFTLRVARGSVVALLGPNGSGKTTSLKAAAGLVRPTAGRVLIGDPPAPAPLAAARRAISFLPQRVAFPDALSGREVIEFYRRLRGVEPVRAETVLRMAALDGASRRRIGSYSGGMVQRLGLAVAMLPDAPVLLLDEPTAALDPEGLLAFYDIVEQRKRDRRTVLFTSHQLGDVDRLADSFAVLVKGRLVALLDQQQLAERLAARGLLNVTVDAGAGFSARIRELIPRAEWDGHVLAVPGPADRRPAILEAVRAAGGTVQALSTVDGRLDMLYRELVQQSETSPEPVEVR